MSLTKSQISERTCKAIVKCIIAFTFHITFLEVNIIYKSHVILQVINLGLEVHLRKKTLINII